MEEKQKKIKTIITNVFGMEKSKYNIVLFKNDNYVWAQYYLGLFLEMPTIIVIRHIDYDYQEKLKHKLVKLFIEVRNFDNKNTVTMIANKIAKYVKQNKI